MENLKTGIGWEGDAAWKSHLSNKYNEEKYEYDGDLPKDGGAMFYLHEKKAK